MIHETEFGLDGTIPATAIMSLRCANRAFSGNTIDEFSVVT
ncbi:MAG: hypothetical protein WC593_02650 [Methanoregula sp.]